MLELNIRLNFTYRRAIEQWQSVLGVGHVVIDETELRAAESATYETHHHIPAILKPESTGEVRAAMEVANRFEVPVYPVSTGKNWGYGSRVPASDQCALLDLSRMNRILDFHEELAYVTVEPGVTQRQLFEFLRSRNSKLWMDATGASPDCSIIGNTVERGFGHTPYGDHFAHVCGLQVVLGNGEIVETGFSGFDNCHSAQLYRWGVGPSLDGLFSQSGLGIVTRMTIWLMPEPECFQAFFFRCDREEMLPAVIDALRPLRLDGTLRSTIHIGNDYKVLSGIQQYPWDDLNGRTPLQPSDMTQFRQRLKFGCWNGSGGLYGSKVQVAEARRLVSRALKGKVSRLQFVDEAKLALAERFCSIYEMLTGWDLSRTLELARPVLGLMKGQPTEKTMASVYWRKPQPPPPITDPDRDGCGLLWLAPILPLDGAHTRIVCNLASEVLLRHGFEPMISLSLITERAIAAVVSITYDRHLAGQDQRAALCHDELLQSLLAAGYPPYRLGIASMPKLRHPQQELLAKVRQSTDPKGILAPGRYSRGNPQLVPSDSNLVLY